MQSYKDKDPIEGEDLGLDENDFLLSRKVSLKDLEVHNKLNTYNLFLLFFLNKIWQHQTLPQLNWIYH